MIIGKDNNFNKPSFATRFENKNQTIKNNNKYMNNPLREKANAMQHSNIMSKEDMNNKAFVMLQERLSNGTITLEEFNRKCIEIGKRSKH